jgi:uncharacterized protein YjiS (DUF1127 family)
VSNRIHARALAVRPGAAAPAPLGAVLGPTPLGAMLVPLLGRVAAYLRAQAEARAARRRARESVRQLMELSNRELKDIGISRSEILSVVYGPADGRRIGIRRD